jgi:hypothetical protein
MSLQLLAKQMEAKGRKGDSMLVHMTPGEVAGLQKLAEAAGGSLSVNPETGLVEANFLKRMLPTLVGLGVGAATMNPFAGAAAGAAVGGYQARRNDQDVLLGAAMGGLGGYGGAGIGSGLTTAGATGTAAQAISNPALAGQQVATGAGSQASMLAAQNAGFGAQGTASLAQAAGAATPSTAAQIGQGISALGNEAGRSAFMQGVGGGAGLVSDIGMATAPLMAPGKRPGEAPVDDEMYSYEYNPGRTGAERSPMATTAERRYFDSGYSPMRKIKASQYGMAAGGLLGLAEGGSTGTSSEGMTGASKAAFDYLMGRSEDSGFAGQGSGSRGVGGSFSGGDGMYSFDPATGQFTRNPNYVDPEELERQRKEAEAAAEAARQAAERESAMEAERERLRREAEEAAARKKALSIKAPQQKSVIARAPDPKTGLPGKVDNFQPDTGGGIDYQNPFAEEDTRVPTVTIGDLEVAPDFPSDSGGGFAIGSDGSPASGYGTDSWSGGMDSYSGSDRDVGNVSAAGGSISLADGGLMSLAKGGMKSGGFVVPADVVSMIGEGNTDAGYSRIKSMIPGATAIKGKDGGQADTVKTSIEGKQPARVAHGEMYIPPETVKRMGGAKKLYAMMDRVRQQATGSKKQIKPVSLKRAMA